MTDEARVASSAAGAGAAGQGAPSPSRPPAPGVTRPLAFFDLDGTLVAGQTQQMLVAFLRERGLVNRRFLVGTVLWFAGYKLGLVEATDQARARGAALLEGMAVPEVERLMAQFREERLAPRLYPPALERLAHHRRIGDRAVILSAAFDPLVRTLASRLGVTDHVATRLEVEDGRYTGHVEGRPLYGEEKASAALAAAAAVGVAPESCWAYADHETDLDLLRAVGHPVVVRPKAGLRRVADAAGWPVIG